MSGKTVLLFYSHEVLLFFFIFIISWTLNVDTVCPVSLTICQSVAVDSFTRVGLINVA